MLGFSYLCANIPNEKLKSVRGPNIPNEKLKLVREELIKFDFHGRRTGFFSITEYSAIWINNQQKYRPF